MRNPTITDLTLGYVTGISTVSLETLGRLMPKLRRLNLTCTNISDDGLSRLTTLKKFIYY